MMSVDEKVRILERMRIKARMSYLYLGIGLLAVLAVICLFSILSGAAAGLFLLALYWVGLRKPIREFQHQYKAMTLLHCVGKEMQAEEYAEKDLLSVQQAAQDGCLPVNILRGIVRAGVVGTYRDCFVQMSDISSIYRVDQRTTLGISGCYVRIHLAKDTGRTAVWCTKGALPGTILDEFYIAQGLSAAETKSGRETVNTEWLCYGETAEEAAVSDRFAALLQSLRERGDERILLKLDGEFLYAFVRSRYLGVISPDYKKPVSRELFEAPLFPELQGILRLAGYAAETWCA